MNNRKGRLGRLGLAIAFITNTGLELMPDGHDLVVVFLVVVGTFGLALYVFSPDPDGNGEG